MSLKAKLVLSVALLVLGVVLAVLLVSLAGAVRAQVRQVGNTADYLGQQIYNQESHELELAYASHRVDLRQPRTLGDFYQGLGASDAMQSLFSSAIGYQGSYAVRDVALVTPSDRVVADSNSTLVGQILPTRPLLAVLGSDSSLRQLAAIFGPERVFETRLEVEVPLPEGGPLQLGAIRVGVDTVLLRAALAPAILSLAISGALIVLLSTLLAAALSGIVLRPLSALSTQLDRMMTARLEAEPLPPDSALLARRDEFGVVAGKIQRLGRQVEDVRHVYTTLQENVAHVLDRMEEGLLVFDATGACALASAAAPELLGLDASDIVGRPVTQLLAQPSPLDSAVRSALAEHRALPPCELRRADGRALLVRLDPVRARAGQAGSLLTVRDAVPMRQLADELELARRLSAIGRLTRGVAHEVKNPLNAITIHLELLRQKADRGARGVNPHIGVIRREIERLDRVVKTFLDFTRPVELQLAPTDLGELVRAVGQLVGAGARAKGMEIRVETPARGPEVWVDRDLVEQVLLNLVNNGLQAMESVPGREAGPRELWLEVAATAAEATVRVRDCGPGVAEEIRDRIFDLYFTTREGGTGIGLALASRIMELHDGRLSLDTGGDGASFLLQFTHRVRPQAASGEYA